MTIEWQSRLVFLGFSYFFYFRGTVIEPFVIAHHGSVSSIRIFNSSEMMISGGYDKRIVLWNINQKMAKIPIRGHQDWVTAVDGSTCGRFIVSGTNPTNFFY